MEGHTAPLGGAELGAVVDQLVGALAPPLCQSLCAHARTLPACCTGTGHTHAATSDLSTQPGRRPATCNFSRILGCWHGV